MQTLLERFSKRKQLSAQVDVRYLPASLYVKYIEADLQPGVPAGERKRYADLTDAERKDAEDNYHELSFVFSRMSPAEVQKWDVEALRSQLAGSVPTDPFMAYIKQKLHDKLISIKHEPKDGSEPIKLDAKSFKELLDFMSIWELLDLARDYRQALDADAGHAEGNGSSTAKAG